MNGAIAVLGMHRSGTSCLAGMLSAAGLAHAGDAIRNWDNARGHHEMLDLVRIDEAVLAHSGGHWLAAPRALAWTDAHAAARDRLLAARVDGRPALLKDPRMLLALPFWRASSVAFRCVGIVRHPLAVARSLESWRGMPLLEGIALWTVHNRALAADRAEHGYPIIDFDAPKEEVVQTVASIFDVPPSAIASAYEEQLVHHDDADAPPIAGLDAALALHATLAGGSRRRGRAFPRAALAAFGDHLGRGERLPALRAAREALGAIDDVSAVLVPVVTALVRQRAFEDARSLVDESARRLDPSLADLLRGKIVLAAGEPARALSHLEAACAGPHPYFQARSLMPQALRAVGRHEDARAALRLVAHDALYAHGPLATLAEWSMLDGDAAGAIDEMTSAIEAAPAHRRGRLRTRLAEWLVDRGEHEAARHQLDAALAEDPGYTRSAEVRARLPRAAKTT